jgi:hypothetical protein
MTDFLEEMDKLAAELARAAQMDATALGDKIDAFKALTPYWVHKNKGRKPDQDGPNFDDFSNLIEENGNGKDKPGVRGRRERGN